MYQFNFQNSLSKNDEAIRQAFQEQGMTVVDISREGYGMWTWVLVANGELWLLDKSHGGGNRFQKESHAK